MRCQKNSPDSQHFTAPFCKSVQIPRGSLAGIFQCVLRQLIGAVTHTMVNAISHGKASRGASHFGVSITCYPVVTRYEDYPGKKKSLAVHWRENLITTSSAS